MASRSSSSSSKDNSGRFSEFVALCKDIEEVSAHTEKSQVMKEFLSDFKGDVYLLYKLLFAKENQRKFNLKDKKLVDVCASAFGEDLDEMIDHMDSKGDVSETLKKYLVRSDHARDKGIVTLKQVDDFLEELTQLSKKEDQIRAFKKFVNDKLTGDELKFICRIICKDLKIRAGPKYLLAALHSDAYQSYILTHDLKQIVNVITSGSDLKNLSMTAQSLLDIDALIKDADSDDEGTNFDMMNISDDEDDKKKKSSKATSSNDKKKTIDKKKSSKSSDNSDKDDDSGDETDIGENVDDIEEKPEELVDEESEDDSKKKKKNKKAPKKIKISTKMKLFHPVKPMLARPSKTYDDVIARCPNGFYSELKYDGERIQIHYDRKNDEIKYFSRNLKDVQEYKIKSVKKYISKAIKEKVESVILDGEILMMDTKTNKILPFGTLGKNVRQDHKDAVTTIFLFDILYYNGKSLLSVPLYKRKALMTKIVNPIKHRVMLGEYLVVKGSKQTREAIVSAEMSAMIKKGEEGLVLKDLCSPYEPNARHWLKMKKDYLKGMADSVDLVVLGAYLGTGSKGGLMSVFMMGSFDKKLGKWRIICKCGNGHDDQTIETLNEELKSNMKRISKDPSLVPDDIDIHTNALVPDFIVKDPKKSVVWEIQGAEFSVSSRKDRPISVRFPRVTKIRDDKDVLDHTNYQEIIKLKNESNRKGLVPIFGDADAGDDSDESVDVKDKKKRSRAKKSKSDDEEDESDSSSKKKKNSRKKKINSSDDEDDEDDKKSAKKANDKKKSKSSDNSDGEDDDPKAKKAKKSTIGIKLSDIDTINDSSTPEQIYYIYGDFMKMPMNKEEKLISHCVDDSSRWSDKGSMGNIELLYGEDIKKAYTDDMNIIGDAQIVVALPNHLCNMVCLQFVKKGSAPKVDYHALDECLKKCATYMNQKKIGTFHLYRLHHAISGLDWNRVEQLLKENLSNKGFAVFIYTKDRDDKDRVNESKNNNYACPELLLKKAYGSEVDVYALGVLLYKILFGCFPFRGAQQKLLMHFTVPLKDDVNGDDAMGSDDCGQNISKCCKDLLHNILEVNCEKRFSIQDIKNHQWYKIGKTQKVDLLEKSWKNHKPFTRYGQLPYLKVSDDFHVYQTLAIARYLAQEGNLYPLNERRDATLTEEVVASLNEVLLEFFRVFYEICNETEKEEELKKFKEGTLQRVFSGLNNLLNGTKCGYFIEGMLTWADLFLLEIVLNLESVGIANEYQRLKQILMENEQVKIHLETRRK
ncbi:predicted protein [Naegleria gruberi]|uniref:DNA ligase n=1 Tax=Naegleria gruberi TaxID=5762 RepID=D2W1U2_NAEGR|nr:uncharacterized protein NAEGRDRAFT_75379 [Naegleria gruberi]EFC36977.1 predicted protein [Naegleria gruberi]|eukprot:XP_002669721.1 predicted protein [Naegleria gruberi strain NEG-M]